MIDFNTFTNAFKDVDTGEVFDSSYTHHSISMLLRMSAVKISLEHPETFAVVINGQVIQYGSLTHEEIEPYL